MKYDYLIVGSGFFGAICAYELNRAGYKCLVLEKRNHIGGNCFTENKEGINIHKYGAHIFHTSNEDVWKWINQFCEFNNFINSPVANYRGEIYSLPFSMWTFSKLFNVSHPDQVKEIIEKESSEIKEPKNLEEQAIKLVGKTAYEKLIRGYTKKQWKKDPKELPKEIINRLPVRLTYNNNYFRDKYQGIPIGGYTRIFEKLLEGIEVIKEIDYLEKKEEWNLCAKKIIYTGPIDRFYNYIHGKLEYKTVKLEEKRIEKENFQGTAVMNFTEESVPYTRIIEHKHFDPLETDFTWISEEYPIDYVPGINEPYYPVNDKLNNEIYQKYKELSEKEEKIYFGGRLAEYKYYDMHQVIESALNFVKIELGKENDRS
jgi:UDP-galactopyranose mutase